MKPLKVILVSGLVIGVSALVFFRAGRASADIQRLPDLKLTYLHETPDLAGKPVLLEFWATWCPPCRESIPHLNAVYARYRDRDLEIVAVTDEERSDVEQFLQKMPMQYPIAFDPGNQLAELLKVRGIPHAFLANAEGVIVWRGHPMELRDAEIEKALRK